jgi:hypothetical protein
LAPFAPCDPWGPAGPWAPAGPAGPAVPGLAIVIESSPRRQSSRGPPLTMRKLPERSTQAWITSSLPKALAAPALTKPVNKRAAPARAAAAFRRRSCRFIRNPSIAPRRSRPSRKVATERISVTERGVQGTTRKCHVRLGVGRSGRHPAAPPAHQARVADPAATITRGSLRMAEGVGFEPTVPLREQRFSRPSHSAALAPFRRPL